MHAAVAVLTGHDAAETLGKVGGRDGDGFHSLAVVVLVNVEEWTDVEDADGGVGVERGAGAVAFDDASHLADKGREILDWDRVVFDEGDGFAVAGDAVEEGLAGFAEFPGVEHGLGVGVGLHRDTGCSAAEGLKARCDFFGVLGEVLDVEHGFERAAACGFGHQLDIAGAFEVGAGEVDNGVVEEFNGRRVGREDGDDAFDGGVEGVEAEDGEALGLGERVQGQFCAEGDGKGAFAAAEERVRLTASRRPPPHRVA